jgi:predicted CXXCH cytochrome family protein
VAAARDPHRFRGGPLCQACHAHETAALQRDAVDLCVACHQQTHGNHPVRVAPARAPAGVRLWQGKVACHTCHDPHAIGVRSRYGMWLEGDALCLKCHDR